MGTNQVSQEFLRKAMSLEKNRVQVHEHIVFQKCPPLGFMICKHTSIYTKKNLRRS